jgi:pyruvate dehydrogenase E2 component (dihydrolipoamide acetyltransferase)
MPALSPTMEKGNLAKWLKKEGEKVKPGDVIAEIETDKATMEYEAIDEGTLAKIVVPEGTQDVPVNQLIAVLAEEGEDVKMAAAGAEEGMASAAKPAAKPASAPGPAASAEKRPETTQQDGASTRPQGQIPAPTEGAKALAKGEAPGAAARGSERVFSSPLARRLARDAGIDLTRVEGSGPHGRIIARDIEAAKSGKGLVASAAAIAPAAAPLAVQVPTDDKIRALFEPGSYEVVPHDNIRKVIARRSTPPPARTRTASRPTRSRSTISSSRRSRLHSSACRMPT